MLGQKELGLSAQPASLICLLLGRNLFKGMATMTFTISYYFLGGFIFSFSYCIQHCFICRPSDSTVPTDAGIEPRTVATSALAVRRSNALTFTISHTRPSQKDLGVMVNP
jgi:hypothetical protein